MIEVVTIIATRERSASLPKALDSVLRQSLKPSKIIVLGETEEDFAIDPVVVSNSSPEVVQLINHRTRNLSGALNTALLHLLSIGIDEEETFVAFLDDDDRWESNYLERGVACVTADASDLVVSGIIRHETGGDSLGRKQSIPAELNSSSFLATNPHIQGSNLFVRLSCLLKAGGFDENLESTTDRDVCIRL
ncbi:MAG TPA: glycosyltransferase family A protein, partial [Nitrososphaerales archaeon]|nr:glycosyltransferase family A protein [Nitrososphaerales archaeon]